MSHAFGSPVKQNLLLWRNEHVPIRCGRRGDDLGLRVFAVEGFRNAKMCFWLLGVSEAAKQRFWRQTKNKQCVKVKTKQTAYGPAYLHVE